VRAKDLGQGLLRPRGRHVTGATGRVGRVVRVAAALILAPRAGPGPGPAAGAVRPGGPAPAASPTAGCRRAGHRRRRPPSAKSCRFAAASGLPWTQRCRPAWCHRAERAQPHHARCGQHPQHLTRGACRRSSAAPGAREVGAELAGRLRREGLAPTRRRLRGRPAVHLLLRHPAALAKAWRTPVRRTALMQRRAPWRGLGRMSPRRCMRTPRPAGTGRPAARLGEGGSSALPGRSRTVRPGGKFDFGRPFLVDIGRAAVIADWLRESGHPRCTADVVTAELARPDASRADRAPSRPPAGNGGVAAMSLPAPAHRMPLPPAARSPTLDRRRLSPGTPAAGCAVAGAILRNIGRPAGECASSQADGDVRAQGRGGPTPAQQMLLVTRRARAWIR
jgi:hypothetical protein